MAREKKELLYSFDLITRRQKLFKEINIEVVQVPFIGHFFRDIIISLFGSEQHREVHFPYH